MLKRLLKTKIFLNLVLVVVASLICICAYVYGTFTPNSMTLDKLKEKYTKALIVEWNSYGFNEPAIEYSTDLQFCELFQRRHGARGSACLREQSVPAADSSHGLCAVALFLER